MVKSSAKFIVTVSAPNSSLIEVNKILLTDMNLQFNGRLPAAVLPTTGTQPPITAGLGPGNVSVEPRDVGFPINVNSGPPTNVPYPLDGAGGTGGGYSTGNPADARGFITLVEAPSITTLGGQFQIKIHVRNDGKSDAKFKARVAIESLGIVNEPTAGIVLRPGETGIIRKTMIMPADAQTNKLYPTVIELLKVTDPATEATSKEDEEVSTIPGPNTNVPPTGGGGGSGTQCIIRNGIQYCKSNAFQQGCLIENGIVYCPTASLPQQCITRNNIQYCKAEQFVAGCIIENNTVYCPSAPTPGCPPGHTVHPTTGQCVPIPPGPGPVPVPVPVPGGPAAITMPTSVNDGDSFTVRGLGFQPGERVDIIIALVWQSNRSEYNGKTYTLHREETADSHGAWRETLKNSEVPSGVSSIATVTAKGRQSNRIAQGQIRIE